MAPIEAKALSQPKSGHALVLLSGGLDSTCCVKFLLDQGYDVTASFVDYGQLALVAELRAAQSIAQFFKVPFVQLKLQGPVPRAGEIHYRNAHLILAALFASAMTTGFLVMGLHSGVAYYDCSSRFVLDMQRVVDGYTSGRLQLMMPFLDWTKYEIWEYALTTSVPVDSTYSCELGKEPPCGQCRSCQDRVALTR